MGMFSMFRRAEKISPKSSLRKGTFNTVRGQTEREYGDLFSEANSKKAYGDYAHEALERKAGRVGARDAFSSSDYAPPQALGHPYSGNKGGIPHQAPPIPHVGPQSTSLVPTGPGSGGGGINFTRRGEPGGAGGPSSGPYTANTAGKGRYGAMGAKMGANLKNDAGGGWGAVGWKAAKSAGKAAVVGGLVGGVASSAGGGDFWSGAKEGAWNTGIAYGAYRTAGRAMGATSMNPMSKQGPIHSAGDMWKSSGISKPAKVLLDHKRLNASTQNFMTK
jgi:hypothetical protein